MPTLNPKTSPISELRRAMSTQGLDDVKRAVGPLRASHVSPQPSETIEALTPLQRLQERQLPLSDEPLAQRGLFNAVIGGSQPSYTNPLASMEDTGSMVGAVAKKALRSLPIIAPEAYDHVKAGGLRLYSRLTDAFAKAPKMMVPDKARSIARSGAAQEEIDLRKLEEFLTGRPPMDKIAREDIMTYLGAHPIELDVVRKGGKQAPSIPDAPNPNFERLQELDRQMNTLSHELETRYGNDWELTTIEHPDRQRWNAINDERQRLEGPGPHDYISGDNSRTHWESLQTPGPKENYGETLINFPPTVTPRQRAAGLAGNEFQSSHWDEPNNIVHARHNERRLGPTQPTGKNIYGMDLNEVEDTYRRAAMPAPPQQEALIPIGQKGHFIEEIQGDWPQAGRERGYRRDTLPDGWTTSAGDTSHIGGDYVVRDEHNQIKGTGMSPESAQESALNAYNQRAVPDLPAYKDTYHELALKAKALDWTNDPDAEWLGIADADTAMAMEGNQALSEAGMRKWYDEKHPSALEKMLTPYGGQVGHDNLPHTGSKLVGSHPITASPGNPLTPTEIRVGDTPVLSDLNKGPVGWGYTEIRDKVKSGWTPPGPGMWKASADPAIEGHTTQKMKEMIAKRGFPAMMALLALQRSNTFNGQEQ